ncbi:hypothetical protein [Vibrio phage vB_VmeM-Yong XC32]|nr:hypothetical protein [Vibrio phage vB_VmeM-Yong XC31]QAX96567.1 hypothetical protein [Vibrio phage vB_VmeM-Yong XC32]QAX96885.1 hypothetical protein [Vibrio phage vB_VmeM-Yong MS31]QAX97190.1 hypothetical protein [Vibrio phage vB_VmeM-Yong MS32]
MSDTIVLGLQADVDALKTTVGNNSSGLVQAVNQLESEGGSEITDRTGEVVNLNNELNPQVAWLSEVTNLPSDAPTTGALYLLTIEGVRDQAEQTVKQTVSLFMPGNDFPEGQWSRHVYFSGNAVSGRSDWRTDLFTGPQLDRFSIYHEEIARYSGRLVAAGTSSENFNSQFMVPDTKIGNDSSEFNIRIDSFLSGTTPGIRISADSANTCNYFMGYMLSNDYGANDTVEEQASEHYGSMTRSRDTREYKLGPHASRRSVYFRIVIGRGGGNNKENMVVEGNVTRGETDNEVVWACRVVSNSKNNEVVDV